MADRRINDMINDGLDFKQIFDELRRLKPIHDFEHKLVKYGQWQRYLQTIYRLAKDMEADNEVEDDTDMEDDKEYQQFINWLRTKLV